MKARWKIAIGLAVLWALNPDLEQHRPIATNRIRTHLPDIIESRMRTNRLIPNFVVDMSMSSGYIDKKAENYTRQLAEQIEYESYGIFSVTKLRNPNLYMTSFSWSPKSIDFDGVVSVGFLGMVF